MEKVDKGNLEITSEDQKPFLPFNMAFILSTISITWLVYTMSGADPLMAALVAIFFYPAFAFVFYVSYIFLEFILVSGFEEGFNQGQQRGLGNFLSTFIGGLFAIFMLFLFG